jgi:hypothetical protein
VQMLPSAVSNDVSIIRTVLPLADDWVDGRPSGCSDATDPRYINHEHLSRACVIHADHTQLITGDRSQSDSLTVWHSSGGDLALGM